MPKVYILLKDTPFNKAGTEFEQVPGLKYFIPNGDLNSKGSFTEQEILDCHDWFKLKETPKRGRPTGTKNKLKSVTVSSPHVWKSVNYGDITSKKSQSLVKSIFDERTGKLKAELSNKPYTPKVGETVRVVGTKGHGQRRFLGRIGKVIQIWEDGDTTIDVGEDRHCIATKVEPVEKKQLPSERLREIQLELYAKHSNEPSYESYDFFKEALVKLLDEQHIAEEKGIK